MLEDTEKRVRLTTDRHGKGEMLHTIGNVPSGQELLAKLDLLKEESLHSLLVAEVGQLGPRAIAPCSVGGLTLLPQLPSEVRVTPPLSASGTMMKKMSEDKMYRIPVKINAVS